MATSRREFIVVMVAGIGLAVAGLDEAVAAKAGDCRTGEGMLFDLEVGDPICLTYGSGANGPDDRAMPPTDYIVTWLADAWDDRMGEQRRTLTLAEAKRRHVSVTLQIQRRGSRWKAVTGAV